jgi:F0F1-type ATP synthase epsilon subunit
MANLNVAVVAVDRKVWSGAAKSIVAKTPEGEIGILPGHEPVLSLLVNGVVRIETVDGEKISVAVHGGFFSVDSNEDNECTEENPDVVDCAQEMLTKAFKLGARGYLVKNSVNRGISALTFLEGIQVSNDGFISEYAQYKFLKDKFDPDQPRFHAVIMMEPSIWAPPLRTYTGHL